MKKKILSAISLVEYGCLIASAIAVLIFQFLPYYECIMVALWCYVVGFGLSTIKAIVLCIEIFVASRRVKGEDEALVTSTTFEVLKSKKQKVKAVLTVLLYAAIFAFAIVVLVMYPTL